MDLEGVTLISRTTKSSTFINSVNQSPLLFQEAVGDTDGSKDDKVYFVAKEAHGKFVTIDQIMPLSSIPRGKIKRISGLFSSNSIDDLANTESKASSSTEIDSASSSFILKRRTKSQTQLLALITNTTSSSGGGSSTSSSSALTTATTAATSSNPVPVPNNRDNSNNNTERYRLPQSLNKTSGPLLSKINFGESSSSSSASARKYNNNNNETETSQETTAASNITRGTPVAVKMKFKNLELGKSRITSPPNWFSESPVFRDRAIVTRERKPIITASVAKTEVRELSNAKPEQSNDSTSSSNNDSRLEEEKTKTDNKIFRLEKTENSRQLTTRKQNELEFSEDGNPDVRTEKRSGNLVGQASASIASGGDDTEGALLKSDLQLSSRVVFFDNSGVALHGAVRFIGTFDDVIHAGVELVSAIFRFILSLVLLYSLKSQNVFLSLNA